MTPTYSEGEKLLLQNDYSEMDGDIYFSSVSDIKEDLSSLCLSHDADFDDKTDTTFLYEYLERNESRYTSSIDNLKSGLVRIRDNKVANALFGDLYGEFSSRIDSVEIFDVILRYFGLDNKEFFDKLILKYRGILIEDLSKRMDLKINIDEV